MSLSRPGQLWPALLGVATAGVAYASTRTCSIEHGSPPDAERAPPPVPDQPGLVFEPAIATGNIGETVSLVARPNLPAGTTWKASCDGPLTFSGWSRAQPYDFADIPPAAPPGKADVLIQPWDPVVHVSLIQANESRSAALTIRPLPYRELAPVRMTIVHEDLPPSPAPGAKAPPLTYSRSASEVVVRYNGWGQGEGWKRAMLVETDKGKVLMGNISLNDSLRGAHDVMLMAQEMRLSYPASIPPPVRVVIFAYGSDCAVRARHELMITK